MYQHLSLIPLILPAGKGSITPVPENDAFLSNVDQFHADHNTTIETSMNEVLIKYRASSLRSQQNQSQ